MTTRRSRAAVTQGIEAGGRVLRALRIIVHGQPKPKGSLRHVGRGHLVEQLEGSAPWRQTVAYAARQATEGSNWKLDTTVAVGMSIAIDLPKPKSAPKKRRWPVTQSSGDLDKHLRNIFDALKDAGIVHDDSQIVSVRAAKYYCGDGDTPGAEIRLWEME